MIVVFNATPLISLSKIDAFRQLQSLYGTIYISAEVYQEVAIAGAHLPGAYETTNAPWIQVKHIQHPRDLAIAQRRFGLGAGELSTLILARETEAKLVIIDDLRARKLAQRQGFRVVGTIAILELSFKRGLCSDLRESYLHLLSCGIYLNRNLLNTSLAKFKLPAI